MKEDGGTHDFGADHVAWTEAGPDLLGVKREGSVAELISPRCADIPAHLDGILCCLPNILTPDDTREIWPTRSPIHREQAQRRRLPRNPRDGANHGRVGFGNSLLIIFAVDRDDSPCTLYFAAQGGVDGTVASESARTRVEGS